MQCWGEWVAGCSKEMWAVKEEQTPIHINGTVHHTHTQCDYIHVRPMEHRCARIRMPML